MELTLRIPTWLLFAFLTIAAFAPVAGRWRGWWFVYYGALLVCWVWMSVVAARKAAREDRKRQRKIARLLRQHRNAQKTHREETDGPAGPGTLAIVRGRIIVAPDRTDDEYDEIRRSTGGDDVTVMITDRRKEDRRQRVDGYVVEPDALNDGATTSELSSSRRAGQRCSRARATNRRPDRPR
jgi:hypothetical protein